MFKRNQKGVIDPVFIIVLVLVIAIGGLVYWRTTSSNDSSNSNSNTSDQEIVTPAMMPGVSYAAPDGFAQQTCDEIGSTVIMYPSEETAPNCEDRTNVILLSKQDALGDDALKCITDEELEAMREDKPIYKYDCETLTINGQQAKKVEQQALEEFSEELGGAPLVEYTFTPSFYFYATYYSDESGNLEYAEEFDEFAQSVNFE